MSSEMLKYGAKISEAWDEICRDDYRKERGMLTKCEIDKLPMSVKPSVLRNYYATGDGERYLKDNGGKADK